MPNSPAWAFGKKDFTIALWVKLYKQRFRSYAFLASGDGAGETNKWIFWCQRGKLQLTLDTPDYKYVDLGKGQFEPVNDEWYHLAVTRAGNHFSFYVNGSELSSEDWKGEVPQATLPLTFGSAESYFFMNGLMDDIRIYNRSLSPDEIKNLSHP